MRYRELHPWDVSVNKATKIQEELSSQVSLRDSFSDIRFVGGIDVSAPANSSVGCAVVAILSFEDLRLIEFRYANRELRWPYIPGFLSFREVPVILAALENVECIPDVIIVDGQGIAHPRRFGIAAHLGVLLDAPTIGCAKSLLCGHYSELGPHRGDTALLLDDTGQQIGNVVRTRDGVKPLFVSPGNKISFNSSVRVILESTGVYRLPEPIRFAHRLAKACAI